MDDDWHLLNEGILQVEPGMIPTLIHLILIITTWSTMATCSISFFRIASCFLWPAPPIASQVKIDSEDRGLRLTKLEIYQFTILTI